MDYNYDGLGKRRNKVIDGDATWFRWDAGWNMIAEYDGGANQLDWDPGDLAMTYVPGLAQVPGTNPATGAYGYFAADHLGSTRGVYNQSKAMTAALEYAPYGEPRAWRGDAPAPTYTGHYHDAESGLYFAPYRYYLPDAGRWLTRDPLGMVDGPNVYGYVGGAPVSRRDPLGLQQIYCITVPECDPCPRGWRDHVEIHGEVKLCCKKKEPSCEDICDTLYRIFKKGCRGNPWCLKQAESLHRQCLTSCLLSGTPIPWPKPNPDEGEPAEEDDAGEDGRVALCHR